MRFGRTMMQPLELLQLAKATSPDEFKVTLNSEEIKPVAYVAIVELRLSKSIS